MDRGRAGEPTETVEPGGPLVAGAEFRNIHYHGCVGRGAIRTGMETQGNKTEERRTPPSTPSRSGQPGKGSRWAEEGREPTAQNRERRRGNAVERQDTLLGTWHDRVPAAKYREKNRSIQLGRLDQASLKTAADGPREQAKVCLMQRSVHTQYPDSAPSSGEKNHHAAERHSEACTPIVIRADCGRGRAPRDKKNKRGKARREGGEVRRRKPEPGPEEGQGRIRMRAIATDAERGLSGLRQAPSPAARVLRDKAFLSRRPNIDPASPTIYISALVVALCLALSLSPG